jgi:hypothetical protein
MIVLLVVHSRVLGLAYPLLRPLPAPGGRGHQRLGIGSHLP